MDNAMEIDFKDLCRLCANPRGNDFMLPIFGNHYGTLKICEKINRCLPINVSANDGFPDLICISCTSKLSVCDSLFEAVLQADERLHALKDQLDIGCAQLDYAAGSNECRLVVDGISSDDSCPSTSVGSSFSKANSTIISKKLEFADTTISVVPEDEYAKAQKLPKLNFVLVNVPSADDSTTSDSIGHISNQDKLDDAEAKITQVIAESEMIELQAAESFLRSFEDHWTVPGQMKLQIDLEKGSENNELEDLPLEVRRSRRQKVKNKFYDSDSENHTPRYNFTCKLCNKFFSSDIGLTQHFEKKSHLRQLKKLKCLSCDEKFKNSSLAKQHVCGDVKSFSCEYCPKVFITEMEASLHKVQHSNGPFICVVCNDKFDNFGQLQEHIRKHRKDNSKQHQCDFCGKIYKSKVGLRHHVITHSDLRSFNCYICHANFNSKDELILHRLNHSKEEKAKVSKPNKLTSNKRFPCEICGKILTSKAGLDLHLTLHTDEKPFECEDCGKRFRQNIKLRYHKRLHDGNLPYACTICEKRFNTQRQFDVHMRFHTNERPFICEVCGMRFRSNGVLIRHKNTHAEEPLFACSHCNKPFRTRYACTVHERMHTGEKRFMCDMCGRSFSQKATLDKHRLRHEKHRVICVECNTSFASKKGLRKHFEKKHTRVIMETIPMLEGTSTDYVAVPIDDDLVVEVVV